MNLVLAQEDAREILFKEGLVKLSDISVTGRKHVHIAMIIANVKKNDSSQLTGRALISSFNPLQFVTEDGGKTKVLYSNQLTLVKILKSLIHFYLL